jgi:tetratricopeptide (TPR) repeat protein
MLNFLFYMIKLGMPERTKTVIKRIQPSSICLTLYLTVFYSSLLYFLIQWPIVGLDTDLWYHLNSGRYIFTHHSIPHSSFFSFIAPSRDYIDYYWLFQALVYQIYSLSGYLGLILLRTVLYISTITLILFYLFNKREKVGFYILLILFFIYSYVLLFRFELVRPHTFSYLFIILFIYVLEYHSRKVYLLPILGILWVNLHGIEYPVMFLILLAYIFESFINHIKAKSHLQRKELGYIIPLVLSLFVVYCTPHGSKLFGVPFTSIEHARNYLAEFKLLSLTDLMTFQFAEMAPSSLTFFNILWPITIISFFVSIWKKDLRISHLFLFLGGSFLIFKGFRFTYEFVLLALPLIKRFLTLLSFSADYKKAKWVLIPLIIFLLLSPLYSLKKNVDQKPKFPFSGSRLPQGVVTFLNHIPAQGRLLNHPNTGGYLQWMLYPRYKIFMDMEVPFLFKDEDFLLATDALINEVVLKKFLLKYDPSFITLSINNRKFKEIIKKFPDYLLVFFDSAEVLYLNQKHYPALAYEYGIRDMDPYDFFNKPLESIITEKNRELVVRQLIRMKKIFPDCLLTNQLLGMVFNASGDYKRAIPYCDAILKNFPENCMGYLLEGEALKGLNRYDQAISSYQLALLRANESDKIKIYKPLAYAYVSKQDYGNAYTYLKKGTKIFASTTSFEDLFDLSSLALRVGESEEAVQLLRYAYLKVPLENTEWRTRIEKQFTLLGVSH